MLNKTSKSALLALTAVAVLAAGQSGVAEAQTRLKQNEPAPTLQLKVKPAKPGPTRPAGPTDLKSQEPVALPDFALHAGLGGSTQGLPNQGFCKRKAAFGAADTVAFKVQFATQGATPAGGGGWGQTQTRVVFQNGGSVIVPMGQPAWDGTQAFEVPMPANCYGNAGACQFTIQVDWNNVVPETSNANNSTTKSCMQPAG